MSQTAERVFIASAAVIGALPGTLAYLGIYRAWAPQPRRKLEGLRWDARRSWPITSFWFCGGVAVQFIVYATRRGPSAYDAVALVGLAMLAISVWTLHHVPWRLHPSWYRNETGTLAGDR